MASHHQHHPKRPAPLLRYQKHAAVTVTALLFPLIILISIPHPPHWLRAVEGLTESVIVVAVVFSTTSTYRRRLLLFLLAIIALLANVVHVAAPKLLEEIVGFAPALFFAFVIFELTADVFRKGGDRTVKLLAAMNLYVLAAAGFARVYMLIEQLSPGAYHFSPGDEPNAASFLYFSISTQTTLGFGDIIPIHPLARSLAGVHAMLGVLYLAVIIAAIVGAGKPQNQHA